jgi:hypothetical protein
MMEQPSLKQIEETKTDSMKIKWTRGKDEIKYTRPDMYFCLGMRGCLPLDEQIKTPKGNVTIKDFVANHSGFVLTDNNGVFEYNLAVPFFKGIHKLFKVVTDKGIFRATAEHPFFSDNRWLTVSKLKVGQTLSILENTPKPNNKINYDQATILSISEDACESVYDLAVNKVHNFYLANGLLTHNSGKSTFLETTAEGFLRAGNSVLDLFGCYDEQTEVLTKEGFKLFSSLLQTDEVATLNQQGYLEYVKPTKIHKYPYNGNMVSITGKCNFLVTPNHRMLVEVYGKRKFVEAQEIYDFTKTHTSHHTPYRIPKSAKWNCTSVESIQLTKPRYYNTHPSKISIDNYLPLLGWYLAEGSVRQGGDTLGIGFALNKYNPYEINQVAEVVQQAGFKPHICEYGVIVHSQQLYNLFKPLGHSHKKAIPMWVKDLPPTKLKLVLDALVAGDGHVYNNGLMIFSTVSSKLADDIQEIAIKCGYASTLFKRDPRIAIIKGREIPCSESYDVTIHKEIVPSIKRDKVTLQHYEGFVYCVSVPPNETVLVRRLGKVAWSGNSRDGESLAWLRSPWAENKKILLLKGDNVDVKCSWPVKNAEAIELSDFENYDLIISSSPLYQSIDQEFSDAAIIENKLYQRLEYDKIVFMCCREASNFFYSRLKVSDNQLFAKSEMTYLLRESRHMGVSLGLDSIRSYAIDIDIRQLSDYMILKAQGVQGLSRELKWLYSYIDASVLRKLPPEKFFVITKNGSIGAGKFGEIKWHKQERENILNEVGVSREIGEIQHEAQNKGTFKTVSDKEHKQIIERYGEGNVGMMDLAKEMSRSSRTISMHVDAHNTQVDKAGFCGVCKRAQSKYVNSKVGHGLST